jgi:hypothetical protein
MIDHSTSVQMTVIDSTGHHKPVVVGVKVHKKANVETFLDALGSVLQPSFSSTHEHLLCFQTGYAPAPTPGKHVLDEYSWIYSEGRRHPEVYRLVPTLRSSNTLAPALD